MDVCAGVSEREGPKGGAMGSNRQAGRQGLSDLKKKRGVETDRNERENVRIRRRATVRQRDKKEKKKEKKS